MREDRWQHMVHAALLLEEQLEQQAPSSAQERRRRMQGLLDSLLEVFPSSLDPVDDFEGFAVRKLAQALQRALESGGASPEEPR